MARIRTVKPEFWLDEKISSLSYPARLLAIGILNFADDAGRARASLESLKSQIFPYDDAITRNILASLVQELEHIEYILPYEVRAEKYYLIRNFKKHQRIDRPSRPLYPPPPSSLLARRGLVEQSPQEQGTGKGKEGKGDASFFTPNGPTTHPRRPLPPAFAAIQGL